VVGVSLNQSKLIAYYLGQEGIENIRNIRDTNWLNDRAWDQGISSKVETIDKFTRETIISQLETNVLEVKIIIEWSERGREHSVEVINHLYNWL
jgi:hypothetical protein